MREKIDLAESNVEKSAKLLSIDALPDILGVATLLKQIYEHSVDIADFVMPEKNEKHLV